jgi:hypothetical protein
MICDLLGVVGSIPAAVVFTTLGAVVVAGRGVVRLLSTLAASLRADAPARRHHPGTVRDHATAAAEAARMSGLLARPRR